MNTEGEKSPGSCCFVFVFLEVRTLALGLRERWRRLHPPPPSPPLPLAAAAAAAEKLIPPTRQIYDHQAQVGPSQIKCCFTCAIYFDGHGIHHFHRG